MKFTAAPTIIVIDDDPDILDAVEIVLLEEGFNVLTTTRGDQVLKKMETPDLFLIDIWMSGQNGKDICRSLKENPITAHIPVILFSANKDTPQIAEEAGANDYLLKPFDIDELILKIKKQLGSNN